MKTKKNRVFKATKKVRRHRDFEPMDVGFAVFNGHINNAFMRTRLAFIKKFGQKVWDEHLAAADKDGIMVIFQTAPTEYTKWYAEKVQEFVNDGREYKATGCESVAKLQTTPAPGADRYAEDDNA